MAGKRQNMQLFALRQGPPERLAIAGWPYRLVLVFKHDFYAMTCLYELQSSAKEAAPSAKESLMSARGLASSEASSDPKPSTRPLPKVVVKFGREQSFCGLPLDWLGRHNRNHEESIYRCLEGIRGLPRWVGRVGRNGYAIEYIEGQPLDHTPHPPVGFFESLRQIYDAVHARGVAYVDSNKRSNVIVGPDGQAYLIDFQISLRRRDDLPILGWMIARIVKYLSRKDLYHLYKHKRRMSPHELTPEEDAISRERTGLHKLHTKLTDPYRRLRRRFLRKQYQSGRLVSPTAALEDHWQPEKETWRVPKNQK